MFPLANISNFNPCIPGGGGASEAPSFEKLICMLPKCISYVTKLLDFSLILYPKPMVPVLATLIIVGACQEAGQGSASPKMDILKIQKVSKQRNHSI